MHSHLPGLVSFLIVFALVGLAGWGLKRRCRVIYLPGGQQGGGRSPLVALACIAIGVGAVVAVAGKHHPAAATAAARPAPAPAPARTVIINHTITRVVASHPWLALTGTEVMWMWIAAVVAAVAIVAIVMCRLGVL